MKFSRRFDGVLRVRIAYVANLLPYIRAIDYLYSLWRRQTSRLTGQLVRIISKYTYPSALARMLSTDDSEMFHCIHIV